MPPAVRLPGGLRRDVGMGSRRPTFGPNRRPPAGQSFARASLQASASRPTPVGLSSRSPARREPVLNKIREQDPSKSGVQNPRRRDFTRRSEHGPAPPTGRATHPRRRAEPTRRRAVALLAGPRAIGRSATLRALVKHLDGERIALDDLATHDAKPTEPTTTITFAKMTRIDEYQMASPLACSTTAAQSGASRRPGGNDVAANSAAPPSSRVDALWIRCAM